MFLEERHQLICSILERHGRVTVSDLAERFDVTEDCIRKDLKQLAAEGKCRRVYGGATSVNTTIEYDVHERVAAFQPEKETIARKAVAFIEARQTIYLDISSTNLYLARLIAQAGISCTIISPMIDIVTALSHTPQITAICPGGVIHPELNGFVGSLAADAIDRFRFDVSFIGAYGVDIAKRGILTFDHDDGLLKHAALLHSARSYLVCETRKLNAFGNYQFAHFGDFDALVCEETSGEEVALVREAGLEVI